MALWEQEGAADGCLRWTNSSVCLPPCYLNGSQPDKQNILVVSLSQVSSLSRYSLCLSLFLLLSCSSLLSLHSCFRLITLSVPGNNLVREGRGINQMTVFSLKLWDREQSTSDSCSHTSDRSCNPQSLSRTARLAPKY